MKLSGSLLRTSRPSFALLSADLPTPVSMARDYNAQYRRRKSWIDKIKTHRGCAECGFKKYACALDFDHIDPATKEFLIPRHLGRGNLKKLFREIRKCRIVCANCHRFHSNNQWKAGITSRTRGPNVAL